MTEPDVVVIGGGPAGLASAIICATHGLATVMVERHPFPIDKPCGEGLMPNGAAALERLGVAAGAVAARAQPIAGIRYITSRGRSAEALFNGRLGLGMRRADLSRVLFEHARRLPYLDIVTGQAARVAVDGSGRPRVSMHGAIWHPRLVIGADGLHSRTRASAGISVEHRGRHRWGCRQHFGGDPWTDRVEVYFEHGFEAYVTPVAGGVNVAVLWDARVVHTPAVGSPVAGLVARVPALARRLEGRTPLDRPRAGGPFDVRVRRPWRPGVLLIGDAAGYVDPLTGEGVGLALEQALLLAGTVIPALDRGPRRAVVASKALARFAQTARAQSRPNRQLTHLLACVARYPSLVERLVAALASHPSLMPQLLEVNLGRRELWQVSMSKHGQPPIRLDNASHATRLQELHK